MEWRKEFFAKQFTKKGLGLEIGPSHTPIAAKKDGYNVKIVDHANQEDLVKKYKALNIDTENIEEVDYVWDGTKTLSDLIGKPHSFDYIIASHLIEHTTDFITFMQDCESLLKPSGKLCLAVPDKRYCFDYFRFPSSTGDILQAYYNQHTRHTPGKAFDATANAVWRDKKGAWSSTDAGKLDLIHDTKHAHSKLKEVQESEEYVDLHNWMFTPESFRLLIHDLQALDLIKMSYADELPTQGFEFFVVLSPKSPKIKKPRIELANAMMDDIKAMLKVDEELVRQQLIAAQAELNDVKQQLDAIKKSKRWRYTAKPAQILGSLRGTA